LAEPTPTPPAVAGAPNRDANDDLTLVVPSLWRYLRATGRALIVRCPQCGGGPVLKHWLRLADHCGKCGIELHRGETDFYIGAIAVNLALAEGLFAVGLVWVLLATWPAVPWDALEIWAPILMLATPIVMYPISKLLWLAADLTFRPRPPAAPTAP
jgi:uncharacterized protein (DUF983 family)